MKMNTKESVQLNAMRLIMILSQLVNSPREGEGILIMDPNETERTIKKLIKKSFLYDELKKLNEKKEFGTDPHEEIVNLREFVKIIFNEYKDYGKPAPKSLDYFLKLKQFFTKEGRVIENKESLVKPHIERMLKDLNPPKIFSNKKDMVKEDKSFIKFIKCTIDTTNKCFKILIQTENKKDYKEYAALHNNLCKELEEIIGKDKEKILTTEYYKPLNAYYCALVKTIGAAVDPALQEKCLENNSINKGLRDIARGDIKLSLLKPLVQFVASKGTNVDSLIAKYFKGKSSKWLFQEAETVHAALKSSIEDADQLDAVTDPKENKQKIPYKTTYHELIHEDKLLDMFIKGLGLDEKEAKGLKDPKSILASPETSQELHATKLEEFALLVEKYFKDYPHYHLIYIDNVLDDFIKLFNVEKEKLKELKDLREEIFTKPEGLSQTSRIEKLQNFESLIGKCEEEHFSKLFQLLEDDAVKDEKQKELKTMKQFVEYSSAKDFATKILNMGSWERVKELQGLKDAIQTMRDNIQSMPEKDEEVVKKMDESIETLAKMIVYCDSSLDSTMSPDNSTPEIRDDNNNYIYPSTIEDIEYEVYTAGNSEN